MYITKYGSYTQVDRPMSCNWMWWSLVLVLATALEPLTLTISTPSVDMLKGSSTLQLLLVSEALWHFTNVGCVLNKNVTNDNRHVAFYMLATDEQKSHYFNTTITIAALFHMLFKWPIWHVWQSWGYKGRKSSGPSRVRDPSGFSTERDFGFIVCIVCCF